MKKNLLFIYISLSLIAFYTSCTNDYEEAKRLLDVLKVFLPIPSDAIPEDAILREFIGGSYFE